MALCITGAKIAQVKWYYREGRRKKAMPDIFLRFSECVCLSVLGVLQVGESKQEKFQGKCINNTTYCILGRLNILEIAVTFRHSWSLYSGGWKDLVWNRVRKRQGEIPTKLKIPASKSYLLNRIVRVGPRSTLIVSCLGTSLVHQSARVSEAKGGEPEGASSTHLSWPLFLPTISLTPWAEEVKLMTQSEIQHTSIS